MGLTETADKGRAPPRVSLIVAMARNRVIGADKRLPWHLPDDLKHFRRITLGKPIVMGRLTHESIGRALPGRRNLVVSRTPGFTAAGCEIVPDLASALASCAGEAEVMVIGGAQLYTAALGMADRIYLTYLEVDVDGDRAFPRFEGPSWRLASVSPGEDQSAAFPYEFRVYERVVP